jgi:hypothetical protein
MDYVNIGSLGVAQVGQNNYQLLSIQEGNFLLTHFKTNYPVPDEFLLYASYRWKGFQHDFGTYYELVIAYDDTNINEEEPERLKRFWDWVNKAEDVNLDVLEEEFKSTLNIAINDND